MNDMELVATSTFGLESLVSRELETLGIASRITQSGRIHFNGDIRTLATANVHLRTADRVLLMMGQFEAADFGELFDRTYAIDWQELIPADGAFPVLGRSVKSVLTSVPACQKIVKKAIVEKLRAAHGVSELPETGAVFTVEVALLKDVATITVDTSGAGLNKRGYRPIVGVAPLKETLAAAMVMLSFYCPQRPLIDPFCGTGTIPIEAALIARNIAPGVNRSFAAENWPTVGRGIFDEIRAAARDLVLREPIEQLMGTDTDGDAVKLARRNAQAAGVADDIHFQERPFSELRSKKDYGVIITNPPYGVRVGEARELQSLYRSFPEVLRRLPTWSHYILTAYPDFEQIVGQPASRRRKLYNGRIECTFYQFHGPRLGGGRKETDAPDEQLQPSRQASVQHGGNEQAFGGLHENAAGQAEMFANRLAKNARHLRKWQSRGIECYRIYDKDIPEVPLVVDRYGPALHIAEYVRPDELTPAEHADWLEMLAKTAARTLDVPAADVFLKRRNRQKGANQYERLADEAREYVVMENGLKFRVNLSDYLDTGLFLDHRIARQMVRNEAAGKRFLNLFAYTGSFSVFAAAGGAKSTTTVDLSQKYLDWAEVNMTLNGFAGPQHEFVRCDAVGFLQGHPRVPSYDLVVFDPPTFSNSKSLEEDFDVQQNYLHVLELLAGVVTLNGVVYFSTNFRRFKFDEQAAANAGWNVREITRQTLPEDFRNKRIHRCWRMVKV
ncbi:MAG TPA: bifunctional 23S rRNA (guanine(2069)-N(7))-methyltransferase RlmK/23S rRNA (guanine(2445)-N(2))-methyltransferase RlmL [Phycisphaerae bacterium]|nr:bifunctional 23S rRNA (guanine(2069)-N(7))-methyltransferase RlmK/23S rRNA (guanine(2445)-N(2))-methyltransferase RlmL [Phycisphaerae bacterium]HPS52496.1 bifunctional 23S rRNA (guanine(2069)-N(7))-methyltransferase RlmK/23S rRNA (guanine(2445)-N(2))-methyltransferase RlmL [Phycisphaerae bacterium]